MEDFLRNFTGISWNPELGLKVISHVNPSLEASLLHCEIKSGQAKLQKQSASLSVYIKKILHRQEYILLQYPAAWLTTPFRRRWDNDLHRLPPLHLLNLLPTQSPTHLPIMRFTPRLLKRKDQRRQQLHGPVDDRASCHMRNQSWHEPLTLSASYHRWHEWQIMCHELTTSSYFTPASWMPFHLMPLKGNKHGIQDLLQDLHRAKVMMLSIRRFYKLACFICCFARHAWSLWWWFAGLPALEASSL